MMKYRGKLAAMVLVITGFCVSSASTAEQTDSSGSAAPTAAVTSNIGKEPGPTIFRVGGAVTPPKPKYSPEPKYPKAARKAKQEGVVVLRLVVTAEGKPRDIKVARRLGPEFDKSAIDAVSKWKFRPAMLDGKPVAVGLNVEVSFHLY